MSIKIHDKLSLKSYGIAIINAMAEDRSDVNDRNEKFSQTGSCEMGWVGRYSSSVSQVPYMPPTKLNWFADVVEDGDNGMS